MKLYESPYHIISFDSRTQIITDFWTAETENMTDEEFQEEMLHYRKQVVNTQAPRVYANLLDFQFGITPKMQEWVDKEIIPIALKYIKKSAFLFPKDFIAGLSIEQLGNETESKTVKDAGLIRYFSDEKEAINWLLKE